MRAPKARSEMSKKDEGRTYYATHSIACPWPKCPVRVSESASSTESQSDADNKAESAAWTAYNGAAHEHDLGHE